MTHSQKRSQLLLRTAGCRAKPTTGNCSCVNRGYTRSKYDTSECIPLPHVGIAKSVHVVGFSHA